jgi:hypothetical protein
MIGQARAFPESSDVLDGFCSGPEDDPPGWLGVLTGYFDESMHHQEDDWMCVAGFIGSSGQWKDLAKAWPKAIAPRKRLHMNALRFNAARPRTKKLLERAADILRDIDFTPAYTAVLVSDYADLVDKAKYQKHLQGYYVCAKSLALQVIRAIPPTERIELVFENQTEYSEGVGMAMQALRDVSLADNIADCLTESGVQKLAKWGFVPKHSTILTEPADYLSYALVQNLNNAHSLRAQWCKPVLGVHGGNFWGGGTLEADFARKLISNLISLESKY